MKKIFLLSAITIILFNFSNAQKPLVPKIDKAVYFDISPPLKDMAKKIMKEDRSWKDGVVKNHFVQPEAVAGNPVDPALQDVYGLLPSDSTIINVDGIAAGNSVPPDTYGEAGPNHYFQVVNTSYAIFNKSGNMVFGPYPNSSVWSGMPNNSNSGDAIVLYDEDANRWIFTQFSLPGGSYYQMIAVSQTPDPTGSWYRWQFQFPSMPDYPKFGVWHDAYYMSSNNFTSGWVGNGAFAFDRDAMLAGDPDAIRISFNLPPGSDGFITLYPSDCDGPLPAIGTPNYFGFIKTGTPQSFGIYEFNANFSNPTASTFGNKLVLGVTAFNSYINGIPQLGTTAKLETLSDRLMYRLQYRKFNGYDAMVVNHAVNTGTGNAGIRWYEFRKTTGNWSVYQQSTYAPDNHYRWMGSIAMDTAGSIALGYSVSSSSMFPAIRFTGRHKNDPLNQMTIAEKSIIEGGGCQTGVWSGRSRWGDYSGMSVDPAAPTTFWFTTEYYASTSGSSWKTRIGSFTFDNIFSAFASAAPALICNGDSTQLNVTAYGGSNNFTYSWSSNPPGFTSNLKNPKILTTSTSDFYVVVNDGTQTIYDTITITVHNPPYVNAGNDTLVCEWLHAIDLHGVATDYKLFNWATGGDGTFGDHTALETTYTFGPIDIQRDSVEIILFAMPIIPCTGTVRDIRKIHLSPCTGTENLKSGSNRMSVQPNPAGEYTTIVLEGKFHNAVLSITGMDGRIAYKSDIDDLTGKIVKNIDLKGFSNGIYVVQVIYSTGKLSGQLRVE